MGLRSDMGLLSDPTHKIYYTIQFLCSILFYPELFRMMTLSFTHWIDGYSQLLQFIHCGRYATLAMIG